MEAATQRLRDEGLTPINPPAELTTESVAIHVSIANGMVEAAKNRRMRRARRKRVTISAVVAGAVGLVCFLACELGGTGSIVYLLIVGGIPNALVWCANLEDRSWDGVGTRPRGLVWNIRRAENALVFLPSLCGHRPAYVVTISQTADLMFGGFTSTLGVGVPYTAACVLIPALAWGRHGFHDSTTAVIPPPQRGILFVSGTARPSCSPVSS